MASAPSLKEDSIMVTVYTKVESQDFDSEALKALEELNGCQTELDSLNTQASKEISKLEVRFDMLKKPHIARRTDIINKLPHFWSTAFSNHPALSSLVQGGQDYFHYLTKIEVEEFNHITSPIYRIDFFFEDNPYFENEILTKEFHLKAIGNLVSHSVPVKWKEGMNLSEGNEATRTRTGFKCKLDQMPFFTWYNDHLNPSADAIAEIIKADLWKNPLQYFLDLEVVAEKDIDDEDEGDDTNNEEQENKYVVEEDQKNIICYELE